MSTEVLELPDLKDADTGPEMFHYVRKEKIAESAVMGTFVVALCVVSAGAFFRNTTTCRSSETGARTDCPTARVV